MAGHPCSREAAAAAHNNKKIIQYTKIKYKDERCEHSTVTHHWHTRTCTSRRSSLSSNTSDGESNGGGSSTHMGLAHIAREFRVMRRVPDDAKIQAMALDCRETRCHT